MVLGDNGFSSSRITDDVSEYITKVVLSNPISSGRINTNLLVFYRLPPALFLCNVSVFSFMVFFQHSSKQIFEYRISMCDFACSPCKGRAS